MNDYLFFISHYYYLSLFLSLFISLLNGLLISFYLFLYEVLGKYMLFYFVFSVVLKRNPFHRRRWCQSPPGVCFWNGFLSFFFLYFLLFILICFVVCCFTLSVVPKLGPILPKALVGIAARRLSGWGLVVWDHGMLWRERCKAIAELHSSSLFVRKSLISE